MMYCGWLVLLLTVACAGRAAGGGSVTLSGLSSGAFFAVQYHISHSNETSGVAVLSGGPYWCAQENVLIAQDACMVHPNLIFVKELVAATEYARTLLTIDALSHLSGDRVLLMHGSEDFVVVEGVLDRLEEYYAVVSGGSVVLERDFTRAYGHGWPTLDYGVACTASEPPYINNCGWDAARDILTFFYGTLQPKGVADNSSLIVLNQEKHIPFPYTAEGAGLEKTAYAYVPRSCASDDAQCSVHVSFHGCEQNLDKIGKAFVEHVGLNEWAESNSIIVVYPQAACNLLNPNGCWDWWGYTGADYACKLAAQIQTVHALVREVSASLRR